MECANAEYCLCISIKPTNQPTNQLTNQPTNQRTGVVKYTDACIWWKTDRNPVYCPSILTNKNEILTIMVNGVDKNDNEAQSKE